MHVLDLMMIMKSLLSWLHDIGETLSNLLRHYLIIIILLTRTLEELFAIY